MKLKNLSRRTTLSSSVFKAASFTDKALGLLDPSKPEAIMFKTRFGIHTFGMKRNIDVIILDADSHVVALKESLPPNRVFLWNITYDTVIELPSGTIRDSKTTVGDKVVFE